MTHASNPLVVECPANTWVKVATAVVHGTVHKLKVDPSLYKQTYRITGEAAPTDDDLDAGFLFQAAESEVISHDFEIDVYVKAVSKDGRVRVDV